MEYKDNFSLINKNFKDYSQIIEKTYELILW